MMQWKIGCSGYQYAEWKGIFYPDTLPKSKWFEFYCQHFNSIELNTTFYRFPRVEFLENWYNRAPDQFTFSVKAPRLITHFKRLKDSQKYLADFYSNVKNGLREKAGCILFQFPANFVFEKDLLTRIISLLDPAFNNVVEFRHPSWWDENVFEQLRQHHIIFCGLSHPTLPQEVIQTTERIYYRMHGIPHLYVSRYDLQTLAQMAHDIQQHEAVKEAFVYFNNTAEGAAITNGKELQDVCELVH
jgi:uncharacterized protein YecE (DUF72 family)